VAFPRVPVLAHRYRRSLLATLGASACLAGVLPAGVSVAAPQPSIPQVKARIAALGSQVERIAERYNAARIQLGTAERKAATLRADAGRVQAQVGALQSKVGQIAAATYRGESGGTAMTFLSDGNPQTFFDRASALDQIARSQARELAAYAVARHRLTAARQAVAATVAQLRKTEKALAANKSRIAGLLAQERSTLDSLQAKQRAELAAQQRSQQVQEVAQRASYSGPATGSAGAAVRFAYAQLGKPYQWGGSGPSTYDCSGLTMMAWAAGGVSLPHNAAAQYSVSRPVSMGALQPGDLLFMGSPAYHVAIYVGNGEAIEAPYTGADVRFTSAGSFSYAARP